MAEEKNSSWSKAKARSFFITLNNYTQDEYDSVLEWEDYKYLMVAKEVGKKCGTPHIHVVVCWPNPKSFGAMKKMLPRANIQRMKGTATQASTYIEKENDFVKFGECPKQGERKDIQVLIEDIKSGKRKVDDMVLEEGTVYHQYGRTLTKAEDIVLRKKFRTEMTKGIWYYGATGVGKSHMAFEGYDPNNTYIWSEEWWDGYVGQETVIINEFRGQIPYNQLLQMVDKWPFNVRRRNREPAPFLAKKVIITSSLPPGDVYKNRNVEDSIEQLLRRFEVIEVKKDE